MKNAKPIDDLEMHDILRLIYPEHIKSDGDEYFEQSQDLCDVLIPIGNGIDVTLAEFLGRLVMLSPPMQTMKSPLFDSRLSHCLGRIKIVDGSMQVIAAVHRDFVA